MRRATSTERSMCTDATSDCSIAFWVLFGLAALQGCFYYDENDRCGPNMSYSKDAHLCFCDSHSVPVPGGCTPCAKDHVPMAGKCVCPEGKQENDSGECEAVAGLGDSCDADNPCNDTVYNYCATPEGESEGICTNKCTKDDDCDEAYTCADWESEPYCKLFSGVGTTCSMPGPDDPVCTPAADYCFMGQCFVRGCTVNSDHALDSCPKDRKCCDVSFLNAPGVSTACVILSSAVCK